MTSRLPLQIMAMIANPAPQALTQRGISMIRQELRRLTSQYLDGSLMYPGEYIFTWVKADHMPWVLLSIVSAEAVQP